jgi:hypothetical protein
MNAAKRHLTKNADLSLLLAAVQDELNYALELELPQSKGTCFPNI